VSVQLSCLPGISSQLVRRSSWCLISLVSSNWLLSSVICLMALDSILSRVGDAGGQEEVVRQMRHLRHELRQMVRMAEVLVEGRCIAAAVGLVPEQLFLLLLPAVEAAGAGGHGLPAAA
jgi:hypothetical protein